jgi:hypothetical protein
MSLTVLGVLLSYPGFSFAQEATPTVQTILQAWGNRQEKVSGARFGLSLEETIHKGSVSLLSMQSKRGALSAEPNPARDYFVKGTGGVSVSGVQLRYFYDIPKWDPVAKSLYQQHYNDAFDGKSYKFFYSPASGQQEHPIAGIRSVSRSESSLKFPILPVVFAFRGNHPQFFDKLPKFEVTGRTIAIGGRPCCELVQRSASYDRREVLYLDRERDYVTVRDAVLVNGQPSWQLDVTYNPDPTVGWVPASWEYIIRAGGNLVESGRRIVTHYEINPSMDRSEFDVLFPPGTRVLDESSGHQVQYIIRENGDKGKEIPGDSNPTYQDLEAAGARFNRWVLVGAWGGVFLSVFVCWIWVRRRRAVRSARAPEHP